VAAALAFAAVTVSGQPVATPAQGEASFGIFLRGAPIGREQTTLSSSPTGWILTSTGATQAPLDMTIARFEMKYSPDWQPLELTLEARLKNAVATVRTSFGLTTAINEVTQNSKTVSKEDQISAKAVVLPNNVFGAYEALAVRLWPLAAGAEVPVYIAPQGEVKIKLRSVVDQSLTGPSGVVPTRRFDVGIQNPDGAINAIVTVDNRLRLVRFELPDAGFLVVRDDASSVAVRPALTRNPTDADLTIPANGFNLAGTITTPPVVAGRLRLPAVVLVGGAAPADRDMVIGGIPIFAQLARELADHGDLVIRYDRRGAGQSGGRTETATVADYAEDILAVVRAVAKRDDVDKRHIVVAGYGDGAAAAMLAGTRGSEIDGIVTIDGPGTRGADLILEQQQRLLDGLNLPPAERQARIELQRKIQAAVTGTGTWAGVPETLRRQADTPWFRSVLLFDPAQVVPKIRHPMLILHAEQDPNIPASEADRLSAIAKARKKDPGTEVSRIPGITQTLAAPNAKTISSAVATAIAEWIKKL
jgi:uncharacterized protein